ncbi:MAG: arginase family protein [Candidatus Limnocylindrales bacterium]
MAGPIVLLGVPTALGGHREGMERSPAGLRELGLVQRLTHRPAPAGVELIDAGDLPIEPGFRADPDPRAKNRALICQFLPRLAERAASALASAGQDARLFVVGGDCTAHAGALAGLRRRRPSVRIALAWLDAHGDFNTPATTPSGNVWGMPFAMACGRGEADLLAACDAPTVEPRRAALLGGQVLDEQEARDLAASPAAHFGAGLLATPAGQAALAAWAASTIADADGLYLALDLDCIDAAEGLAVQMPESHGMSLATVQRCVRALAAAGPVLGFGATTVNLANGDAQRTVEAIATLAEAALQERAPVVAPTELDQLG